MESDEPSDTFDDDLGSGTPVGPHSMRDELIGFALTFVASLGICFSLNLQKLVHVRNVDPATGQASVSFLTLPLWWVGVLSNAAAELLNLAALGYAPATLVTPLGCLTVVFNCVTSAIFLKEQFLRRDLLGIILIGAGVVCVVWSQVGSPAPPITPRSLREDVLPSASFWILVGGVVGGLALIYAFLHEQYKLRTCWIFLAESSLVSTLTVVSARCFASFLPYPMPGEAAYFYTVPDCWYTWGSLALLAISAVGGLLLQNAALMHFKASEVVPIYFCMFALSGVAGSGLAFGELQWPWVLMLIPGVTLCIGGVFAISHRREQRIAQRLSLARQDSMVPGMLYEPPLSQMAGQLSARSSRGSVGPFGDAGVGNGNGNAGCIGQAPLPPSGSFHGLERGLPPTGLGARGGGAMGRHSAGLGGGEMSRGVSALSEACSVASVTSVASLEESPFFALGGGAMSLSTTYRMARAAATGETGLSPTGSLGGGSSSSSLMRAELGPDSLRRCFGRAASAEPNAEAPFGATNDPLLPRCSEEMSSTGRLSRPTMSTDAGHEHDDDASRE